MSNHTIPLLGAVTAVSPAASSAPDPVRIDQAFEALKAYDYGSDRGGLRPIDDAVRASLGEVVARGELERRLASVLKNPVSRVAKEYVCRKLGLIGSAASVPALAECLSDQPLAPAARSALEAMPCPEAVQAIRDLLPKLEGLSKVGAILALGSRREASSVPALAGLLEGPDIQSAGAAAYALGEIGTVEAARALRKAQSSVPTAMRLEWADAGLVCAERLLKAGHPTEALALYRVLTESSQPEQVRSAAQLGLAKAAEKQ